MNNEKLHFVLEGLELKAAKKWIAMQKKQYPNNSTTLGERFTYKFTPTGLGVIIKVHDSLTGNEEDVTNYDLF